RPCGFASLAGTRRTANRTQCLVSGSMTNTCPSNSSSASRDGSRFIDYHYHKLIRTSLKRQACLITHGLVIARGQQLTPIFEVEPPESRPHFLPRVWKGGASAPPFRQPTKSVQTWREIRANGLRPLLRV